MVVFVQSGDVVVDVFLRVTVHADQTVVHDHCHFVRVSWIVRDTVRNSQGLDVAVAVFVLQTFTVQGGTA
ncbi:hypothetical protein D3C80_1654220 [compost metagenome]